MQTLCLFYTFAVCNYIYTTMENGLIITDLLKRRGMNQTELAEKIGISRVGLSKAINGNTTIATLQKIADALGVSVPELFAPLPSNVIICPKCGTPLEFKEK